MDIIQTDADGTIYKGNLLVSLGWKYLHYLLSKGHIGKFLLRVLELPFYYFISLIPKFVHTAFIPFRGCPIFLVEKLNNKLKENWIKFIESSKTRKIRIISHQDKTLILGYLKNKGLVEKYNFEIISNEGLIHGNVFSGKAKIIINKHTKYDFINKDQPFLGDFRDYRRYGRKNNNFVFIK